MNVAFDPWIPVVSVAGKPSLASLADIFSQGDKFADLAVRPHERVSLMRLFLCVAHAALDGPKDYDEWLGIFKRLPEAAITYLDMWKDSFDLFHPTKPWLQIAELTGEKTSPVTLLDFEMANGNNSTLYDHGGQLVEREVDQNKIALTLLTFQNFSSGGGSPIAQWRNVKTSQVGNPDAPCLSQSMAHCLFRGRSLTETIRLNLPTVESIKLRYKTISSVKKDKKNNITEQLEFKDVEIGNPVWECFPCNPASNSVQTENATKTYLGRLVPISRWIRLLDERRMYCCNGFKYVTHKDGFPAEPTASVHLVAKRDAKGREFQEREVVKVKPTKALWRELSALLTQRSATGLGGPLAMENVPYESGFDFHVCAMTRDQASMDIALESVFHISPSFQLNLGSYQGEAQIAESISRKLGWAIETYRKEIDGGWEGRLKGAGKNKGELKAKLHSVATTHYWTSVENNLQLLFAHVEVVGTDSAVPTRIAWRNMLISTARDAYRIACGQETARQLRAFAKGLGKLTTNKSLETDSAETMEMNT